LNSFKLVPRLKRIKNERLYLPAKGMAGSYPNLGGVLTRPILINTILIQRVLQDDTLLSRLTPADLRGLSPLFFGHINPYGLFFLDYDEPSFLEAA